MSPRWGGIKGGRNMAEVFQMMVYLSVGVVLILLLLVPALAMAAVCVVYMLWELFHRPGRGRTP